MRDGRRSVKAEIERARYSILRNVNVGECQARIDDHRAGLHPYPERHEHHCYACLAFMRRNRRRKPREKMGAGRYWRR